ncbi:MAG: hypothetical protein ACMUIG_04000 [Thermoplasmatota archaeon]
MKRIVIDEIRGSPFSILVEDRSNRGMISVEEDRLRISGFDSIMISDEGIDLDRDLILNDCGEILFMDCDLDPEQKGGKKVEINRCDEIKFLDSSISGCDIDIEGRRVDIEGCSISEGMLNIMNTRGPSDLVNNTYTDSVVNFSSSDFSAIRNNTFERSDLRIIYRTDGVNISENRFLNGTSALYLEHSFSEAISNIIFNIFESCMGIHMSSKYGTPLGPWACYNWNITRNYFGNCSDAVVWPTGWGYGIRIWLNLFYHNMNTGDNGSGRQVSHYRKEGYMYDVQWYLNGVGNFWQNHRTPDNDSDNIVDIPYVVTNGVLDLYPLAKPYYDTSRPSVWFESPLTGKYNRSYFQVRWNATDRFSGIDYIQMSIDGGGFFEITGEDWIPVNFDLGTHEISLKAVDGIGLFNITSVEIEVLDIDHPVGIIYPGNGDLITGDPIWMAWRIEDYFPLKNRTVVLDGEVLDVGNDIFEISRTLSEGDHVLTVTATDMKNCTIRRRVDFSVDLDPPDVEIISPPDGSILSNHQVRFHWRASDLYSIKEVRYRVDGGIWIASESLFGGEFDRLLNTGDHSFEVEAVDRVGHRTMRTSSFSIMDRTGLVFTSPPNGYITPSEIVDLQWEYTGPLEINYGELGIRSAVERTNVTGSSDLEVSLPTEGEYDFLLRLFDVSGNYVEADITIIRDLTPPVISLDVPEYINSTDVEVRWSSRDNYGIHHFEYNLDGSIWIETMGSAGISLSSLSEGAHAIEVKAVDHAGNENEDMGFFFVDVTEPDLDIKSPVGGEYLDSARVSISWTASDNGGIEGVYIEFSGRERIFEDSGSWDTSGIVGSNYLTVTARDLAGNTVQKNVTFFIDLAPPFIKWLSVPKDHSTLKPTPLSWTCSDDVGISKISMEIDGDVSDIETDVFSTFLDLSEGEHTVSIVVWDHAGRLASVKTSFILDTMIPVITLFERSRSDPRTISWTVHDNTSGVRNISIFIDDILVQVGDGNGSLEIDSIDPGLHTVTATAYDIAGNIASEEMTITIDEEKENNKESVWWILLIMLIFIFFLIVITAGAVFIFMRSRSGEPDEPAEDDPMLGPRNHPLLQGPGNRDRMIKPPPLRQALPENIQKIRSGDSTADPPEMN